MLEGIEILSQEVVPAITNSPKIFIIGMIITLVVSMIFIIFVSFYAGFCTWIVGVALSLIIGVTAATRVGEYTKYQVIISEDVNLREFIDKYEIIEQNGEIFTVKEKENNKN